MRNNQPITITEHTFPADQRLISTTDQQGQITYCNQAFIDISGFTAAELQGAPHNLVRHPDVPPAVFAHMWQTLKQGKPWMGIVKNRCKNGDFYWVNAYVTPILQDAQVIGYESVRVKPSREQIARASALYERINQGKPALAPLQQLLARSGPYIPVLAGVSITALASALGLNASLTPLAALTGIATGLACLSLQQQGLKRLLNIADRQTSDPLIATMYTDQSGDWARLELALLSQEARLATCLTRLQDSTGILARQASEAEGVAQRSSASLEQQRQETDLVATAIQQMAATTQEVASNVHLTAEATQQANQLAQQGQTVARSTRAAIERLSSAVGETSDAVSQLAQDSNEIGGVVDVIKSIAEQTNLLALNAAIEAARAGEQGRGFAVVADEVRALAQRTQESTQQIHHLIAKLQSAAKDAVDTMQHGRIQADEGVSRVQEADSALAGIQQAIEQINDMARQIASAAEEQSAVSEEVSRNIANIATLADRTSEEARLSADLSQSLTHTAHAQQALALRFTRSH